MGARAQAVATIKIDEPYARVTEYRFSPGAETGWHRHRYDYVVVPLLDGQLTLEQPDGSSRIAQLLAHQPYCARRGRRAQRHQQQQLRIRVSGNRGATVAVTAPGTTACGPGGACRDRRSWLAVGGMHPEGPGACRVSIMPIDQRPCSTSKIACSVW